jgi:YfiH family protein
VNRHQSGEIVYLAFGLLEAVPGLFHAVSTRQGGVSRPPYDSLNLAFHVGDESLAVLENRRRFASAAGFELEDVVVTRQVHGSAVRVATLEERGQSDAADDSPGCDALVSRERGLLLMGFSADCPLVMLADGEAGVVGLAHAGWRPAFAGIIARTVTAMKELSAEPSRIVAGISPAIQRCCYRVTDEFKPALSGDVEDTERFFTSRGDGLFFDLPLFCRDRLKACGVNERNIECARTCSRCSGESFFSYRASGGRTGRYAAVVGWTIPGRGVQPPSR